VATESNHVVGLDHFEGGANLQRGTRKSLSTKRSGQTLAQMMRKMRTGRFTAGGAGDTVIAFDTPLDSDNVTVSITGDSTSVPVIKTGVAPDKDGFTITAAGAGPVHWMAFEDGPTS
jgi:hypothetical protein